MSMNDEGDRFAVKRNTNSFDEVTYIVARANSCDPIDEANGLHLSIPLQFRFCALLLCASLATWVTKIRPKLVTQITYSVTPPCVKGIIGFDGPRKKMIEHGIV